MTAHNFPNPELLDTTQITLGESTVPADFYVRWLGGILMETTGNLKEQDARFVDVTADPASGMVQTLSHAAMAAQAHATNEYVDKRIKQTMHVRERTGLWARFADFEQRSAPSAVFELQIEPGDATDIRLWCEEIIYEHEVQVGIKPKVEIKNPRVLLDAVLFGLSKYHLVNGTSIGLREFQYDQRTRATETNIGDYYTDQHGWLRRKLGHRI